MLHKTKGIVLGHVKYGESSLIIHVYTEKFGIQSYIENGVRKAKAKQKSLQQEQNPPGSSRPNLRKTIHGQFHGSFWSRRVRIAARPFLALPHTAQNCTPITT